MVRRPHVPTQTLTLPSVLDRLLDDNPGEPQRDAALYFDLSDFKAALARDLEALLNTRVVEHDLFMNYPMAAKSVIRFGIPDLSSLSLLSPDDRERLRGEVEWAIERFEPRLTHVKVTLNVPDKAGAVLLERMLHFRVDAFLKIHPRRPPVSFDATLQLSSNAYQVRGRGH